MNQLIPLYLILTVTLAFLYDGHRKLLELVQTNIRSHDHCDRKWSEYLSSKFQDLSEIYEGRLNECHRDKSRIIEEIYVKFGEKERQINQEMEMLKARIKAEGRNPTKLPGFIDSLLGLVNSISSFPDTLREIFEYASSYVNKPRLTHEKIISNGKIPKVPTSGRSP